MPKGNITHAHKKRVAKKKKEIDESDIIEKTLSKSSEQNEEPVPDFDEPESTVQDDEIPTEEDFIETISKMNSLAGFILRPDSSFESKAIVTFIFCMFALSLVALFLLNFPHIMPMHVFIFIFFIFAVFASTSWFVQNRFTFFSKL